MNHKSLGRKTVALPEVGIGTCEYHGGPEPLQAGFDAGARLVDTAESYGTESLVGDVTHRQRHGVFIATKVSKHNLRPVDIRRAIDGSLQRLRTDYVDLYQVHEPNPDVPVEETLGVIEDLVDAGKVRFVGVSNFTVEQLQQAQRAMRRHAIVSNQVRYNIVDRTIESGLLAYCQSQGITVIAYSPLGRELRRVLDGDPSGALQAVAAETGKSVPQVVLNWCLSQDGVVVIPKGSTVAHVLDNCGASGWRLTEAQISRLNESIKFRHRSAAELALRRLVPSSAVSTVKRIVKALPPSFRRRLE